SEDVGADAGGAGIVADQGRADCNAGHALFHQGHIEHPCRAILLGKAGGRAEDAFEVVDSLTHDEDTRMLSKGCIHGLEQRAGVRQYTRALAKRPGGCDAHQITSVSSSGRPGAELASAKATAASISRSSSGLSAAARRASTISGSWRFHASTLSRVRYFNFKS